MYTELAGWPCRITKGSNFSDEYLKLVVYDQNNSSHNGFPEYPPQGARSFIREARKELEERTGIPWKGKTGDGDWFEFWIWKKKLISNIENKLHTGKS